MDEELSSLPTSPPTPPATPKRRFFLFLPVIFLLVAIPLTIWAVKQRQEVRKEAARPKILAKVAGKNITQADLDRQLKLQQGKYAAKEKTNEKIKANVLALMIEKEILTQEASRLGVAVSGQEIETELANRIQKVGGSQNYQEILATNGWTLEEEKEKIKTFLLRQEVAEKVVAWRKVSGLTAFRDPQDPAFENKSTQVKETLEFARNLILAGKTPDEALVEIKKNPRLDKGVALLSARRVEKSEGWTPQFKEAIFNLKTGEVSSVVVSSGGSFGVLKVLEIGGGNYNSYEDWLAAGQKKYLNKGS